MSRRERSGKEERPNAQRQGRQVKLVGGKHMLEWAPIDRSAAPRWGSGGRRVAGIRRSSQCIVTTRGPKRSFENDLQIRYRILLTSSQLIHTFLWRTSETLRWTIYPRINKAQDRQQTPPETPHAPHVQYKNVAGQLNSDALGHTPTEPCVIQRPTSHHCALAATAAHQSLPARQSSSWSWPPEC